MKMNNRILIVETETKTALDLKNGLEKLGYEVIATVDDGWKAIDLAAETVPDLVLIDLNLNGDIGSVEAASIISALRIPVVYLTENKDNDVFKRSDLKGVYGFVIKPYDLNKLDKTLRIIIHKSKIEAEKLNDAHGFVD